MSFYNHEWKLTDHAIQRFIERSHSNMTSFEARIEMIKILGTCFEVIISPSEIHYEVPNTNMMFLWIDGTIITFKWKKD